MYRFIPYGRPVPRVQMPDNSQLSSPQLPRASLPPNTSSSKGTSLPIKCPM